MKTPSLIRINGEPVDVSGVALHVTILEFLRSSGRTGTKSGCNEGDCGACTILVLDESEPPKAINGCLALVHSLAGREILTAEGLAGPDGNLHPAQEAMVSHYGSQCGYCTPGFICSMAEASARGICADPAAVADQLCGNLCRCTGYRPIREAAAELPVVPITAGSPVCSGTAESNGYHFPGSLREALELKQAHPAAEFVAGATETAVLINKRHHRPARLISLERIRELRGVSCDGTEWIIKAATPLTGLEGTIGAEYPAFDQMLRLFASRQIRHRATLGGNLVTASPIGDSAPLLLALDASVRMVSLAGERKVPLAQFFTGYRKTILQPGELLVSIHVPCGKRGRCEFHKVSKRREMDISTVSACIRLETDERGVIIDARCAFGGVSAFPMRAGETESGLLGKTLEDAARSGVADHLVSEFTPMSDLRGSQEYRKLLIRDLLLKVLSNSGMDPIPAPVSTKPPEASTLRHESAISHVTGAARYTQDIAIRRGALHVWPIRSSVARGRLLEVDVSDAFAMPGVVTVLTAKDVPGANNTGPARHDEPLFAEESIEFHGQLIAVVVAESLDHARLAAQRVNVSIGKADPLLGIENAIAADSFHTTPHELKRGDVDAALLSSQHRIEGAFHIGGQEQFYLETHASLAESDGEGGVHVWSSTQHPSETQTIVAEVLGCSRNRVVVECPRMGGGFGGKETQANPWAAVCALAAMKTGKPVSIQLDRDHDIESTGKRHPFLAKFDVGYDPEGKLLAADIRLFSDGGWSLDLSLPVNDRALFHLDNAYYIPDVRFTGRVCKTNTTSHTAFRGFGGPQGMLVIEEILGRIAEELELPPDLVRSRNFYRGAGETNTTHYGEEIEDNRLQRIWDGLLESSTYQARCGELHAWNQAHPFRKRGIAITPVKFGISFTLKHYNQAGALVLVYADGSVQVNHGGTEMGQGLHTKILGVTMRELGIRAGRVRLMHTRTDKVPNTSATAASSGADLNGMAVADACTQLRSRLAVVAAELLSCDAGAVDFSDDRMITPDGHSVTFEEVAAAAYTRRVQLSAAGFYATPDLVWDWAIGKGKPFHYFAFGAAVTEVEVDGFTGMHHIRRVDILHDVGDSLNPEIDRGQIEGGYVQGAGWLTSEELKWADDGRLLTHSASTYAIPAFSDAPLDFRVGLLEKATQAKTIHGSKAVGEPPLMLAISVREALRDAIHAFGVRKTDLPSPLTAETVKLAIGPLRP